MSRPQKFTVVALVLTLLASCGERQEHFYPDLAAAKAAGAVERGWIPPWVPKSAKGFHEIHDVDTNQSMLRWSYEDSEKFAIHESCVAKSGAIPDTSFRSSGWPTDWADDSTRSASYAFFACEDGKAIMALQHAGTQVWYWRP